MLGLSTPEAEGISSEAVLSFIDGMKNAGLASHGIILLRHGNIIAEGYEKHFSPTFLHRMYSQSKSLTSLAAGLLISEGKLSYDDTVEKLFPEYMTDATAPEIKSTRVIDLLKMDTPYNERNVYFGRVDKDFVKAFINGKPDKAPGNGIMAYDTAGSHILSAVVERVSGMKLVEYLRLSSFGRFGFSDDAFCIEAPEGYSWGGSGVCCTLRDIASVALLLHNKGVWDGEQIYPRAFAESAVSYQITDRDRSPDSQFNHNGYGYLIWIYKFEKYTGWGFLGMGGQDTIVVPCLDLILTLNADNQGNTASRKTVFDLFEKYILNNVDDVPLPQNSCAQEKLTQALSAIELPVVGGGVSSPTSGRINGKRFTSVGNCPFDSFRLTFSPESGRLDYSTGRGEKTIYFGLGRNVDFQFPEPQYSGKRIQTPYGKGYRACASGGWLDGHTFAIKVQIIDIYFGNMTLTFDFSDNSAVLDVKVNAEWFLDEYKIRNGIFTSTD